MTPLLAAALASPRCTAHRTNGEPCRAAALRGANVCYTHGGAAPQVRLAAQRRIMMASEAIASRLISMALSKRTKDADVIAVGRDLLNRAGIAPEPAAPAGRADGTILWDEFVAIYRRRVPDAESSAVE